MHLWMLYLHSKVFHLESKELHIFHQEIWISECFSLLSIRWICFKSEMYCLKFLNSDFCLSCSNAIRVMNSSSSCILLPSSNPSLNKSGEKDSWCTFVSSDRRFEIFSNWFSDENEFKSFLTSCGILKMIGRSQILHHIFIWRLWSGLYLWFYHGYCRCYWSHWSHTLNERWKCRLFIWPLNQLCSKKRNHFQIKMRKYIRFPLFTRILSLNIQTWTF